MTKLYSYAGFALDIDERIILELTQESLIEDDCESNLKLYKVRLGKTEATTMLLSTYRIIGKNEHSCLYYLPNEDSYLLAMNNGSTIYVTGDLMTLDINWEAYYSGMIERYALKHGMILAARLNGKSIYHGAAFVAGDKAYILVAPSGYGKSTMALALNKLANYKILTDDCSVLSDDCNRLFMCQKSIYINQDSAQALCNEKDRLMYGVGKDEKILYICDDGWYNCAYEFGGAFFIGRHLDEVQSSMISFKRTFPLLCNNIKMSYGMMDPHLNNDLLSASVIAKSKKMVELHYPKEFSSIYKAVDLIRTIVE
ncbi:MAG: hypothetical protein Q4A54_08170 [Parabacteroides sp.]|nr:hypothetical protein [Parabacteroides sp.]